MKKSIKRVLAAALIGIGTLGLCGCGGKVNGVNVNKMIDKFSTYGNAGDYKSIEYNLTTTDVNDDMVKGQIDYMISQKTVTEDITEGEVAMGDTANIDFVGSIDGVEFEGGNTNGKGYDLNLGSGNFIPGFEDQVAGHKIGETFDVNVTFPEDYKTADLAGKAAVFKVTINSAKKSTTPEYNDEFVKANSEYNTVAEFEAGLKKDMTEYYAKADKNANRSAIISALVDQTVVEKFPEQETEELLKKTMKRIEDTASQYGYDTATYVTTYLGYSSEDAFKDYVKGVVEDHIKEKIAICSVAKTENKSVNNKEVEDYIQTMIDDYGYDDREAVLEDYTEEDLVYYALEDKICTYLLEVVPPTVATDTDAE